MLDEKNVNEISIGDLYKLKKNRSLLHTFMMSIPLLFSEIIVAHCQNKKKLNGIKLVELG